MAQLGSLSARAGVCNDNNFFQPYAGLFCRGGFDFSLLFEEAVLVIPIQCILLLATPFRIIQLLRSDIVVRSGILRPLKVAFVVCWILLNNAILVSWIFPSHETSIHTKATIPACALSFVASLFLLPLSWLEHDRSIRPSFITSMYLLFSILLDLPRTRTLWLADGYKTVPILYTLSLIARLLLLLLESSEKRSLLLPPLCHLNLAPEVTSSTISRCLFSWLMPLFQKGFKRNLLHEDLYPLDQALESHGLLRLIRKQWIRRQDTSTIGAFAVVWLKTFSKSMMAAVVPRLCMIGFTYAQPFLLEVAIDHAVAVATLPDSDGNEEDIPQSLTDSYGYGIVGAFFLTYAGIAISTGQYSWRVRRAAAKLRGSVVAIIYEKTLRLDAATSDQSNPEAILTLVGTDVENIAQSFERVHEVWASPLEMSIAVYLISKDLGAACALPIALAFFILVVTCVIAVPIGSAQSLWIVASQSRIAATVKALGCIKWLKLSGLSNMASSHVRKLRVDEISGSRRFRFLLSATLVLLVVIPIWSPILTFATWAGVSRNEQNGSLTLQRVFTSYTLVALLNTPLTNLLIALPQLACAIASFQRLQDHLNGQERQDTRTSSLDEKEYQIFPIALDASNSGFSSHDSNITEQEEEDCYVDREKSAAASISGKFARSNDSVTTVLNVKNVEFRTGSTAFIIGPVGCGKSTLLKALLEELPAFQGIVRTNVCGGTAYADQAPWIPHDTVRNIILGSSEYEKEWYREVVKACCLLEDFSVWPKGDNTTVGTNGIAMTAGQRQQVSVARAVYSRRQLVILDDCLSKLDGVTAGLVYEGLFGPEGLLRRGDKTVIAVSTCMDWLRYADNIIVLDKHGRLQHHGSPSQLQCGLNFHLNSQLTDTARLSRRKKKIGMQRNGPSMMPIELDEDPQLDKTRRLGNTGMYRFYASAAGRSSLGMLVASMSVYAFCSSFPTVWLGWWAEEADPLLDLGKWIGVYAALGAGAVVTVGCGLYQILRRVIERAGVAFHDHLTTTAFEAPLSYHFAVDSGVTVNRFAQDLRLIDMELPTAAFGLTMALSLALAQLLLIAATSKYMAVSLPFLLAALYALQFYYLRTSRQLRLIDIENKAPMYSMLIESLNGLTTIRAHGWESQYTKRFLDCIDEVQRSSYLLTCLQCWLSLVTDMIVMVMAVIFVMLATQLSKDIGPRDVGVGLSNVLGFSLTVKVLVTFWVMLEDAWSAVSRVRKFVQETRPEGDKNMPIDKLSDDNAREGDSWPSKGCIELSDVVGSYPGTGPLLDGVSLSIRAGEKVAICAQPGSGSTSLALALLRLMDIDSGTLTIDGVDIQTMPHDYVRSKLVALSQEACILDSTVRVNVDPSQKVSDALIKQVLRRVQLWEKVEARGGLDKVISNQCFSPGEAQLLMLARAMVRTGSVLILDEFTSSLDEETCKVVDSIIQSWFKTWTVISIVHKLDTVLNYDKVAILEVGKLVEFDSPRALLERESLFRDLYLVSVQHKLEGRPQIADHI